jgi:hypothetical protein
MRLADLFLQDVGRCWVNLTLKYRTVPQVYRITNRDGTEKYFKYSSSQAPDGRYMARITQLDSKTGLEGPTKEYMIKGTFDVKVQTMSGLPFSKEQAEQKAFSLFDRGLIDAEEVLKTIDYPNREAVLERLKQAQAAQAQAASQQGAA